MITFLFLSLKCVGVKRRQQYAVSLGKKIHSLELTFPFHGIRLCSVTAGDDRSAMFSLSKVEFRARDLIMQNAILAPNEKQLIQKAILLCLVRKCLLLSLLPTHRFDR